MKLTGRPSTLRAPHRIKPQAVHKKALAAATVQVLVTAIARAIRTQTRFWRGAGRGSDEIE
jgi:hypothetical protein